MTGAGDYILYGGEFTTVNGKRQQGLVRFATADTAPNTDGPRVSGSNWVPTVVSTAAGTAHVSWPANFDRDNESLTYRVIRDGVNASPIFETTESSAPWRRPSMGYEDTGLEPGSSHTYRVRVTDPRGNVAWSAIVPVTIAGADTVSAYATDVLAGSPTSYWRLGEGTGSVVTDWAGHNTASLTPGVTRAAAGAITGDSDASTTFSAASSTFAVGQDYGPAPDTFAIEAWFKTTSTSGGKIVGFGNSKTVTSTVTDRHVYLDKAGRVFFGVRPTTQRTVNSEPGYNDGKWHQVVANLGPNGMQLYVDGVRVGQRTDAVAGQAYDGFWRIGGDLSWGGNAPYLSGTIDDVAIYPKPLSGADVNRHYSLSGRTPTVPNAPADAYGARVHEESPDIYWRLNDTTATTAADSSLSRNGGTYSGGVTTQQAGALAGVDDRAAAFDGTSGALISQRQTANPQVYSLELWFNSTSKTGGKLIGFGDAASGLSTQYDRHVYLQPNGQVVFGTKTTQENRITSTGAYNDGRWHHVVATQSADGLRLYLDGQLAGTHRSTAGGIYNGYWRVGGDRTWGTGTYLASRIDEVAVYGTALDATAVSEHFALGGGGTTSPNAAPTASFTAATADLGVTVDGNASTDSDGTVASHAWAFGDGATGTGATASHSYVTAGTYTVTLTVTDDRGATASTSRQVTVTAPQATPALVTDSFSRTVTGGLGSAEVGGAWSLSATGSAYRVGSGVASFSTPAGATRNAYQASVSSLNTDVVATAAVPETITGAGAYVSLLARRTAAGEYSARVKVLGDGSVSIQVMRDGVSLRYVNVPSVTYAPGDQLRIRVAATGANPTTVSAKVWAVGQQEPAAWQATATDSTSGYQVAGSIGLRAYLSSSATNAVTIQFDDVSVTSAQ
ncbi:LamG-like jellyroll fold domain-containing protein [Microbacteriaceae bacterium 4G12]